MGNDPDGSRSPATAVQARREIATHRVFFPLAMLLAALEIPVWAALYRGRPELAPWHAHEMLFGYALAVVAGFLLARLEWRLVVALATAWLIGRVAMPIGLSAVAAVAALGFALGLAAIAARRFLRAARKGRNRMFAVMLIGMGAAEALFQAGASGMIGDGEWRGSC